MSIFCNNHIELWVLDIADYESEVSFSKFKMADPIWRTPTKKISGISAKIEKKMGFVIYKQEFELICIKIKKNKNGDSNMAD